MATPTRKQLSQNETWGRHLMWDFFLNESGWVYFVQAECPGYLIKIGRTENLEYRLAALRQVSPVPLHLLLAIPGGSHLERAIHAALKESRSHGEWFHPTAALRELVKTFGPQLAAWVSEERAQGRLLPNPSALKVAPSSRGSVFEKNGRWAGQVMVAGKRRCVYGKTREEAEMRLEDLKAELLEARLLEEARRIVAKNAEPLEVESAAITRYAHAREMTA